MATDDRGIIFERLVRLEGVVRQQGDTQADHGGVIDHLVNTMDSIVVPTQAVHTTQLAGFKEILDDHAKVSQEVRDYMISQKGAWAFVQKLGIVIAAAASAATLVMKLIEAHAATLAK